MTYHVVCNKSNAAGATCGGSTTYPSGAPEFTQIFSGVHVAQSLVFCVLFCRSLFDYLWLLVTPWHLQTFLPRNRGRIDITYTNMHDRSLS